MRFKIINMNKKVIGLIFLVFLAACEVQTIKETSTSELESNLTQLKLNSALKNLDITQCPTGTGQPYYFCVTKIAEETGNLTFCNYLTDEKVMLINEGSYSPRDNCIANFGIINQNISVCTELKESVMKDACLSRLGYELKKRELCDIIIDAKLKDICLSGQ